MTLPLRFVLSLMSRWLELFSVCVTTSVVLLHDAPSNATRVALAPRQATEQLISLWQDSIQVNAVWESRPVWATDPTWRMKLRETYCTYETLQCVEANSDSTARGEHVKDVPVIELIFPKNISSDLHKPLFKNLFSFWHVFLTYFCVFFFSQMKAANTCWSFFCRQT